MTKWIKYNFIIITALGFLFGQDSPFVGTWKLAPSAGAMKVGPGIDDGGWWSNSGADVETRACLFDDEYVFHADGTFENILGDTTWLETWQGVPSEQCGTPVAPHDGSNAATWYYDESAQTITLSGIGSFLGLAKAINGDEMNTCGCEAPETRTYNVLSTSDGVMAVYIQSAGGGAGYWTFRFAQEGVELETNVTFVVDMSLEDTHLEGVYLAGGDLGQDGYLMDDSDGDDVWVTTIPLMIGQTVKYKFRNQPSFGTWNGFEPVAGLIAGGCATGQYNDRFLVVPDVETALDTVCYGSCTNCESMNVVNVSFALNMNDMETDPAGPHLSGEAFAAPGLPMLDPDGDDVWTITVEQTPGALVRYKFANGPVPNWQGNWENVPQECQHEDVGNSDRWVIVGETDTAVDTVCFGSCENCIDDYPVDVTFNLDMSSVAGFDGSEQPYVFGSYNNWDNFTSPTMLSDDNGDNIYTGIVTNLEDGVDYEYKFLVNTQWGNTTFESGAPLESNCDFNPTDLYNNYGFTASAGSEPLNLGIHPWNECPLLSSNENLLIPDKFSYKAYPNPFNPYINIGYALPIAELVNLNIINLLGQKVRTLVNTTQTPGEYYYTWDGKDINGVSLQSGIYFAVINRESGRDVLKITFLK